MFQLRIGPPSPPPVLCPHEPYTDFVAGLCQNGEPTLTCTPLTGATSTSGPDASGNCTGTFSSSSAANVAVCTAAGGTFSNVGVHIQYVPSNTNLSSPRRISTNPDSSTVVISSANILNIHR